MVIEFGGMSVLICVAGDIHGAMERLYDDVLAFEAALGLRFDWVLHVGDFGIWPDPERIDRGTRNHNGAGDFSKWLAAGRPMPRRTVFIKGNHENFAWLDAQSNSEVLPGLIYLRNGCKIELEGSGRETACVGGIGGCFFGHHHTRVDAEVSGVSCMGLNKVWCPGNLVAVEFTP